MELSVFPLGLLLFATKTKTTVAALFERRGSCSGARPGCSRPTTPSWAWRPSRDWDSFVGFSRVLLMGVSQLVPNGWFGVAVWGFEANGSC